MDDAHSADNLSPEIQAGLLAARAAWLRSLQPALDDILRGGYGLHPQDMKSTLFADWFSESVDAMESQGDPLAEGCSIDEIITAMQEQIERQRQSGDR